MEESAQDEEVVQYEKKHKTGNVNKGKAEIGLLVVDALLTLCGLVYNCWHDRKEDETGKLDSQPQLEAQWQGEIPIGMEDYRRINLENRNDNIITSGSFNVQYIVCLQTEVEADELFTWENVFFESEIEYDDALQGCFLFIEDDFSKYEESIIDKCADNGIEILECGSYAFCCFQYVEAGRERTEYYLISLKPYEQCKVIEVEDPEKYKQCYLMDRSVF